MKHVAMVVSFAVGAASIVGGVAAQWNRLQPQFKVPSAATIVIATPTDVEINQRRIQKETDDLQAIIIAFSKQYPGKIAIATTDLATGATASVNGDTQMVSASVYKVFVAYGIYEQIDAGRLGVNSRTAGSPLTVGQCLYVMITISDNDCGYALGKMVGWAALDSRLVNMGYSSTKLNNYDKTGQLDGDKLTSANDVQRFLVALYRGELLSRPSTDAFITLLKADKLNMWLPGGLPEGTVIAHKTGALYDVAHDVGLVYSQKGDYSIVVLTQGWKDPVRQPPAVFSDISRPLWNFFTQ